MADDGINDWGAEGCDCGKCLCGGEKKRIPAKERKCSVCGKMARDPEDIVTDSVPVYQYNDFNGEYEWSSGYRVDSCKDCREKLGKAVKVWVTPSATLTEFEKPRAPVVLHDFRMDD